MKNDQEQVRKIFSANLQRYMNEKGVTQQDLIIALDIQSASISSWVNGKYLPRMSKIQKLCEYFGCEPSDLLTEKKEEVSIDKINSEEKRLLEYYRRLDPYGKKMLLVIANQELQRKEDQDAES